MSTLPDVEDLIVRHTDSLREALESIDQTAQGICFIVDEEGRLAGIATDGDIRRGLLEGADLSDDIRSVMETDVVALPVTTDEKDIKSRLSSKIRHIPLLDEDGRPVDYACRSEYRSIPMSSEKEITSVIPDDRPGTRGECPVALITGITGQDGSYLAELLLDKGYEVHGVKRRASQFNTDRIDHLYADPHEEDVRLFLHYGDLTDTSNLTRIIQAIRPDEIYNLAAQSHVQVSFDSPEYTTDVDALGTLRLLEAIRILDLEDKTRFYQASTSELFGKVQETPQTEETSFYPRSPYAAAKLYAYWITVNYREAYGIHSSNGILFNHESPRRGKTFVTRKITQAAARISLGLQEKVYLGNLDAKRDWGHARDYVEGMWRMLQQEDPDDYVLATGRTTTVREFCTLAFDVAGIKVVWEGENEAERGYDADTGTCVVEIDPRYYRPTEEDFLLGDAGKARKELGWTPTTSLGTMVEEMVEHDLETAKSKLSVEHHSVEVSGGLT